MASDSEPLRNMENNRIYDSVTKLHTDDVAVKSKTMTLRKFCLLVVLAVVGVGIGIGIGVGLGKSIWKKANDSNVTTTTVPSGNSIAARYGSVRTDILSAILGTAHYPLDSLKTDSRGASQSPSFGGHFYNRLADVVDTFGPRRAGDQPLEDAIDFVVAKMKLEPFDKVWTEEATIWTWDRHAEMVWLETPKRKPLKMLSIGRSSGTQHYPNGILTASVVVVRSKDELFGLGNNVSGKIVVFNEPWITYGTNYEYRGNAAFWGDQFGAIAVLVRSLESISINSPHTGTMHAVNETSLSPIPAACITIEDAEMMWRMQNRGDNLIVSIMMGASTRGYVKSRDIIAEITGSTYPDEIVVISGHFDSWDVGQGAMDDGCGAVMSWQALSVIAGLGLRPKRTLRVLMWTDEEMGGYGGLAYYQNPNRTNEKHMFVFESDFGVFRSAGLQVAAYSEKVLPLLQPVLDLLAPINSSRIVFDGAGDEGEDIEYWEYNKKIPGGSPFHDRMDVSYNYYFAFHHSDGDTMTVLDSDDMDHTLSMWTLVSYVIADMGETEEILQLSKNGNGTEANKYRDHVDISAVDPPFIVDYQAARHTELSSPEMVHHEDVSNYTYDKYKKLVSVMVHDVRVANMGNAFSLSSFLSDRCGPSSSFSRMEGFEMAVDILKNHFANVSNIKITQKTIVTKSAGPVSYIESSIQMTSPRMHTISNVLLSEMNISSISGEVLHLTPADNPKQSNVSGKIVCIGATHWMNYTHMKESQDLAITWAISSGAVAILLRSTASFSIYSVHEEILSAVHKQSSIPIFSITVEDSEMIMRMQARGDTLNINIAPVTLPSSVNNVFSVFNVELPGLLTPDEVVLMISPIGTPIIGQGGINFAGAAIAAEALKTVAGLGLRPNRTLRVSFTSDSVINDDSFAYLKANVAAVMKIEEGAFKPQGIKFVDQSEKFDIPAIVKLLDILNATSLVELTSSQLTNADFLEVANLNQDYKLMYNYFYAYHNSFADTPNVFSPADMDDLTATWSVLSYAIADYQRPYWSVEKRYLSHRDQILNQVMSTKGEFFNRLANMTDLYGCRQVGWPTLETVIDALAEEMRTQGLDNVRTEEVTVDKWHRGNNEAWLITPRVTKLQMLALGASVGTDGKNITAKVVVVQTFDQLQELGESIRGKIVVYNQGWDNYSHGVQYRAFGANAAMKYGALAVLIRSPASVSVGSPHTGMQMPYDTSLGDPIPAACISIEDADMLLRMQTRGQELNIMLMMEASPVGKATSRNLIAEIRGSEKPHEIVLISGHLDSWDVGQGAMDDGGGAVMGWQTLLVLKQLGWRPKRTLRMVMWTSEETGALGAAQYYKDHVNLPNETHIFAFESDFGVFKPAGVFVSANSYQVNLFTTEIMHLLGVINASECGFSAGAGGEDVELWDEHGVPTATLYHENPSLMYNYYFAFHHSNGDTMSVLNTDHMDLALVVWTTLGFVLADADETFQLYMASSQADRSSSTAFDDRMIVDHVEKTEIINYRASQHSTWETHLVNVTGPILNQTIVNKYESTAAKITEELVSGPSSGEMYRDLAYFVDTFGPRVSCSDSLNHSIEWARQKLISDGFDNVHTEPAYVMKWHRGTEKATLLEPRNYAMNIIGAGPSIGTSGVLTADAIVVQSEEELLALNTTAKGKIIVFHYPEWTTYFDLSHIRYTGGRWASSVGAAAFLLKSIESFSVDSPHTGNTNFSGYSRIPIACLSIGDADMLWRMQSRGEKLKISLEMNDWEEQKCESANLIAELTGTEPGEIVMISGHMDSWDVGQGAMDDGAGMFLAWEAMKTLKKLNLRPRRTIRMLFWTDEEFGGKGARQYYLNHKEDPFVFLLESDTGVFDAGGLSYYGNEVTRNYLRQILTLFEPFNATRLASVPFDFIGTDVEYWEYYMKIPGVTQLARDYTKWMNYYFAFHHSNGDTMTVLDSDLLDSSAAMWTTLAFVLADGDGRIS